MEELDEPVFIPFPGTTKTVPPQMYKGSDPEWKYFVTFSKDKDLQNKVRGGLRSINDERDCLTIYR